MARNVATQTNRERMPVLNDLAKAANVDISTVSRSLNHDPRINPERAEHIRKLARSMGYRPKPLRASKTRAVGLVLASTIPDQPDAQFVDRIFWHVQRHFATLRFHVNVEFVQRDGDKPHLPALVAENRVDGVIMAGHPPVQTVKMIRDVGMPVVAINDQTERLGICCVCSNPLQAMREAVVRLAAWRHERIALALTESRFPTVALRRQGFEMGHHDIDLPLDESLILNDLPAKIAGGRMAIERLWDNPKPPTAILFENDWMAMGAIDELTRRGLNIPADVSVLSHNNQWFCEELNPTLSSIGRSEVDMVTEVADKLIDMINGKQVEAQTHYISGKVHWRDSTGPAPRS